MEICKLCLNKAKLIRSHILPDFAARWLKKTGATPYFRKAVCPNKRVQGISKENLLCVDCESLFSQEEDKFASAIFHPYVENELDENGAGTGKIETFAYKGWLLRFIISLQWRTIASRFIQASELPSWQRLTLETFEDIWRDFLLGTRDNTGDCETHMMFFRELSGANFDAFDQLGKGVNYYLLRTVDATTVSFPKKRLAVYSKLGPIVFFTSLLPSKIKRSQDSKIRMKGCIKTAQRLGNLMVNRFVLIDRPNEVSSIYEISDKQKKVIEKDMSANPKKTRDSLTYRAFESDIKIGKEFDI